MGMVKKGYQVALLTSQYPGPREERRIEKWGVRVLSLSRNPLKYFKQCLGLRREFDLVTLHSVFTPLHWLASIALDCPHILTPNGGYSPKQI